MSGWESEWMLLRPWWLLALVPLLMLLWFLRVRMHAGSRWEQAVDSELREYVLEPSSGRQSRWPLLLVLFGWVLVVVVLAGPVWEKEPAPAFRALQAQVIVLDLSRSMDADDLIPSRLARARHKVSDLLDRVTGIQSGLVVFSEVAYVVSPLTDDAATLKAFLPALESSVVPVQGSRLQPAIDRAVELLKNSAVQHGAIVLLTDSEVTDRDIAAADSAARAGFKVSVLGAATTQGRPITQADGSFVEDVNGQIVVSRLDERGLKRLSAAGGGVYTRLTADDSDLQELASGLDPLAGPAREGDDRTLVQWIERAPWLLLLVVVLAALVWRRGVLQ